MFHKRNLLYVLTLLEIIEKVDLYIKGYQQATELLESNDQVYYNATIHLLPVIGKEAKKIEPKLKEEFSEIPWQQINSMRNYLAHDYRGVDPECAFIVLKTQLKPLKEVLLKMLELIDYEANALKLALDSAYYRHIQYLRKN